MTKRNGIKMNLPAADDLFSIQEERDQEQREYLLDIPLEEISDFPDHPFKVRVDEKLLEMAESIREHGYCPRRWCARKMAVGMKWFPDTGGKKASEMAGRKEIPCIVRELSEDEAILLMVDSNLQREEILPSEKAYAYRMKLEAMKRQAGRPGKNSVPLAQNLKGKTSREILAEQMGESQDQIRRFIRLTELIPPILDMVDDKKIALRPAVELSYLNDRQQEELLDFMQMQDCTPSHAQAIRMRKFAEEGKLNKDVIEAILSEEKGNQKEQFRMPRERISKYFSPGTSARQMEDTIIKALELYRKKERSRER